MTTEHVSIDIQFQGKTVGAVQTFHANEPEGLDGYCYRTRFDLSLAKDIFSGDYPHPNAQKLPFDFVITETGKDGGTVTVFKNVWLTEVGYAFGGEKYVIVDQLKWEAESKSSTSIPLGSAT